MTTRVAKTVLRQAKAIRYTTKGRDRKEVAIQIREVGEDVYLSIQNIGNVGISGHYKMSRDEWDKLSGRSAQ